MGGVVWEEVEVEGERLEDPGNPINREERGKMQRYESHKYQKVSKERSGFAMAKDAILERI